MSSTVTTKLNEWYLAIIRNRVADAFFLKSDIEQLLESMEENQDVLIYFSLLDYRHELMLSQLKPHLACSDLEGMKEQIKETQNRIKQSVHVDKDKNQISRMLEFYYHFFEGTHEFLKNQFDSAISCYKRAESIVLDIEDPAEKGEFYYRLSEVYYHIDQYNLSVKYANRAIEIFIEEPYLQEKTAWCYAIIAGNHLSLYQYKSALEFFKKANSYAEQTNNDYLKSSTHFNLGKCYFHLENFAEALVYFKTASESFEKNETARVPKAYFNKFWTLLKLKQDNAAVEAFEAGQDAAKKINDVIFEKQMNFLYDLYFNSHTPDIKNTLMGYLDFIQSQNLNEDVYQLAFEAARYYNNSKQLEIAVDFYERSLDARTLMFKKGGLLNEE